MISKCTTHHPVICNRVNMLLNIRISNTLWHANQIVNMLETQRHHTYFLSCHFNLLIIFSMSTAINQELFLQCLIVSVHNEDHEPYPLPTVSSSLLWNVSYFLYKNEYFDWAKIMNNEVVLKIVQKLKIPNQFILTLVLNCTIISGSWKIACCQKKTIKSNLHQLKVSLR